MTRRAEPIVEPGRITRSFSRQEAAALADQWLELFARDRAGTNTKAYLWHAFSFLRTPSLQLAEAQAAYELEQAPEFVVLSNGRDVAFTTDVRPTRSNLSDWLVFPPNFAWTMAYTHEDGWLGPFFARHPKYEQLNAANLAALRKAREIEEARLKGWLRSPGD